MRINAWLHLALPIAIVVACATLVTLRATAPSHCSDRPFVKGAATYYRDLASTDPSLGCVARVEAQGEVTRCNRGGELLLGGYLHEAQEAYNGVIAIDASSGCATAGLIKLKRARCQWAHELQRLDDVSAARAMYWSSIDQEPLTRSIACVRAGLRLQ